MPAPATIAEFIELGCKAGLLDRAQVMAFCQRVNKGQPACTTPKLLAEALVRAKLLTAFQTQQLLLGRWHGFILSKKYRLQECIGSGGMGSVYLCEHLRMHRLVAIKVLPSAQAKDPANLERFYREARAVAALNHANIVRAHDIDQDNGLHYLVMEYVEGDSLQNIIKKNGPLDPVRAAHYVSQSADGLEHAHRSGLVHRDIKPANLLLDRHGVVKILDLGLARFFHDGQDDLTKKHDAGAVLGTADYLAPEQAVDSAVDIRADIYSLGATFYFLLAGHAPFHDKSIPQKLVSHQMRQPKPIQSLRKDVPDELAAVLNRMMAKKPPERFQRPREIVEALLPWTQAPVAPPPAKELADSFIRREAAVTTSAELAGAEQIENPSCPSGPDISEIPTAITRPQDPASVPAEPVTMIGAPLTPVPSGETVGADPTSPVMSAMTDTDPFALSKAGGGLISEDSVFCAQFTHRGGSSKRSHSADVSKNLGGLAHRLLPAALAALVLLIALGGWAVLAFLNGPGAENPIAPVTPTKSGHAAPSSEYVAAGSPFGKVVRTISGGNAVNAVALSPDGRKLIVATKDRTPKLWDAATGTALTNFIGHAQGVACVAFSADGETALTGGGDNVLYYWDVKFGSQHVKLTGLTKPVHCVAFAPSGLQAVSGGADNLLHLWDVKAGTIVRPFQGHTQPIWSVAVAPDGRRMLSGSADGTARLWELQTGKQLQEWKGHQGTVRAVAFSPEGRLAATGGQDKLIFLWDADQNKKLQTFQGHTGTVTALAFSPDGRYLLSTSDDGTARVWEPTTGQEIYRLADFTQPISCLSLSADGATLALGGPNQEAVLYRTPAFLHSTPAGQRHQFPDHKSPVEAVAFSPNGKLAASAGHDRIIRLWDTSSFKQIREFPGHQDIIVSLAFSANGQFLLSASRDKTIRLWDVQKGTQLELYQSDSPLQQAVFAAVGANFEKRILAAEGETLRLWDIFGSKPAVVQNFASDSKPKWVLPALSARLMGLFNTPQGQGVFPAASSLDTLTGPIRSVAWSPVSERIASGGADKTIRFWNKAGQQVQQIDVPFEVRKILFTADGRLFSIGDKLLQVWKFPPTGPPVAQTLDGHADLVTALAITPDGQFALTAAKNGEMILWDVDKLRPVFFFTGHKGPVKDVALSPDLRLAISASEDGTVRLWDLPPALAQPMVGQTAEFLIGMEPERLSLSPDGKTAAVANRNGEAVLWDLATGTKIQSIGKSSVPPKALLDAQFSPDGKWLATASDDGYVKVWKVSSGKEVLHFAGHVGPANAVAFSSDGKWLLSGGADKTGCLWDLTGTGSTAQDFHGHDGAITGVAFVPGNTHCLTASADHTLRLWHLTDATTVQVLKGHTAPVLAVAVSPDGKLAVSGGKDKMVCLWELPSGKLLHTFTGHSDAVTCVAFSGDGQRVLSGGDDKTLRLWDVPRRQHLHNFNNDKGSLIGVAFTPDGLHAVSCDRAGTIRQWDLPMPHPWKFAWK